MYLSIQDITAIREADDAFIELLIQAFGGNAATITTMLTLCMVCFAVSNSTTMTTSSRMFYALARDHALPYSEFWHVISPRFGTPVRAILICTVIVIVLGLFNLFSTVVFPALTSISTIGSMISYGLPVIMRLTPHGLSTFKAGPWHLGRYSVVAAFVTTLWTPLITVILMLPQEMPVTAETLNYAPVVFGAFLIFIEGWWIISARKTWTGVKKLVSDDELMELEVKAAAASGVTGEKGEVGTTISF